MARRRSEPPCRPVTPWSIPGLEPVAAEEIERDLGGEVKQTGRGLVVFRVTAIDDSLLDLRTTEDVFLLAWGTDQLTYRAEDLEQIRRWTAREPDWERSAAHPPRHPAQAERQADLSPGDADGRRARLPAPRRPQGAGAGAWPASCPPAGSRPRKTPPSRSG